VPPLNAIWNRDCLEFMASQVPPNSVDLVFGSPPYSSARATSPCPRGDAWVDWMTTVVIESVRISRGLVAFVIDSPTSHFRWSALPIKLMANLDRMGVALRKPPIFHRSGIPGSGGPDWLRNNYEFILCATKSTVEPPADPADALRAVGVRLPKWADPTAGEPPPAYPPGGAPTHRTKSGKRVNRDGPAVKYKPPKRVNPGNVIHGRVGGGHMGSAFAHQNSAPFPEWLAEFFIRKFSPVGGLVYDPFGGSGTTICVAERMNRYWWYTDIDEEQCQVTRLRLRELRQTPPDTEG